MFSQFKIHVEVYTIGARDTSRQKVPIKILVEQFFLLNNLLLYNNAYYVFFVMLYINTDGLDLCNIAFVL